MMNSSNGQVGYSRFYTRAQVDFNVHINDNLTTSIKFTRTSAPLQVRPCLHPVRKRVPMAYETGALGKAN